MSAARKCSFNPDWTNPNISEYASWIKPVQNDPHSAQCTLCCKTFSLSNMGNTAVCSHASSKKHLAALKCRSSASQTGMLSFFTPATNVAAQCSGERTCAPEEPATVTTSAKTSMSGFLLKSAVTKAEIIWCLNAVAIHGSLRSTAASASLFPLMFPGCEVAEKLHLGKDKVGYTICHGIAPYFRQKLLSSFSGVPFLVVSFDESLNKVTQKQQMDVLVRYWDDTTDGIVKTQYLTSCFLGHTCAEDLASAFRKATEEIKQAKILQVSMDGPNVNMKFLRSLKEELKESDESHNILDIGSCGLHVMNGAYKAGHAATGWDVIAFLRSSYNLFKCVPARRADYVTFTGSALFPLKFCAVRWLENGKVITRALEVLPNLVKFVECSVKAKKQPTCSSYSAVVKAVGDQLLPAKLAFMLSMCEELEPFLAEFQTDKPMVPFLSTALHNILPLLARIVKKEILDAADTPAKLLKVDLEKLENCIPVPAFDIGFAAKNELRKVPKMPQLTLHQFKKDCVSFIKVCCQKVVERSPLKYKLTRGASCLDPTFALSPEAGPKRLTLALEVLSEHQWLTGLQAERAHRSYIQICSLSLTQAKLKNFDRKEQRLDVLWLDLCSHDHKELLSFIKIILCLSHGNAAVERGFSVNKQCLVENLKEDSLIAQRLVHDAVSAAGGVDKVVITDKMVQMVRNSYSVFREELQKKKAERRVVSDVQKNKKRVAALVKELEEKKRRLLSESLTEASLLQEKIDALKK